MSHSLPSPLPRLDSTLLSSAIRIVPSAEREDWFRTWHAELWHNHHRTQGSGASTHLALGLIRDALWLRTEAWRRASHGTAALCLATLLGVLILSAGVALGLTCSGQALILYLAGPLQRFLIAAPLVVFVTFATAPRRPAERSSPGTPTFWLKRKLFFAAKTVLLLLLAFFLSADLCQPVHASFPNTADLFQLLFFVVFALVGLRWSFTDQEQRCKQCLRALAPPARVGRPSHNLLEWNGTELLCKQGHGLLSIPEIETSWCQSSQWIRRNPFWDQPAST